jgi:hypothetical protein
VRRRAQKLFLLCGAVTCAGRICYFILWPLLTGRDEHGDCQVPTTDASHIHLVLAIMGTVPAPIFLSAFSVNVYVFAKIYHTILAASKWKFRALVAILTLSNLVVYALSLAAVAHNRDSVNDAQVFSISASSFIVGVCFLMYSLLLYYGVKIQAGPPSSSSNSSSSSMGESKSRRKAAAAPRMPANPMRPLVYVAAICLICFCVRSVLLPILMRSFSGKFSVVKLTVYVYFSEIFPLALMLYIFDPSLSPESSRNQYEDNPHHANNSQHGGGEADHIGGTGDWPEKQYGAYASPSDMYSSDFYHSSGNYSGHHHHDHDGTMSPSDGLKSKLISVFHSDE